MTCFSKDIRAVAVNNFFYYLYCFKVKMNFSIFKKHNIKLLVMYVKVWIEMISEKKQIF
jgi:capsule polysaccharide modification protein KpsS